MGGVVGDNSNYIPHEVEMMGSPSPLLASAPPESMSRKTRNFITPLGGPLRRTIRLTRLDPESRNGNASSAAFHTICSGIGMQALVLPVSFTFLGWTWGIVNLTVAFIWQLYTKRLLVKLHECTEAGSPTKSYFELFKKAFGEKKAKIFARFPIRNLSRGTCVALIIVGGSTSKIFFEIVCDYCTEKPLTTVEWYLVFTCLVVVLSQIPNLNSITGVSLVGALAAIGYCTMMWVASVTEGRLDGVSYNPVKPHTRTERFFRGMNAIGIIAFAFKGHSVTFEIQATMPSSETKPSHVPMWRGVIVAHLIIALCLFPVAILGYWVYGQKIPRNGGMLTAIYELHRENISRTVLGIISVLIILNAASSFQIYAMPLFDDMESNLESLFTKCMNKPISSTNKPISSCWLIRAIMRAVFVYCCFFIAVAIPFLGSVAGLVGGIALPVTFAYPCFMWLKIKKPKKHSLMWRLNWVLGVSGMLLSVLIIAAGIYAVIDTGIEVSFFKPR